MTFLLLDQALGEFDVETKVGFIRVRPMRSAPRGSLSIGGLTDAFDRLITALRD